MVWKDIHIRIEEDDLKYLSEIASYLYRKKKIKRLTISGAIRYSIAMFIRYYIEHIKLGEG